MHKRFLATIVTATVFAGSGLATAGSAVGIMTAVRNCQNPDLPPQSRIDACGEVIHTNLVSHGVLAAFYYNRAVAYEGVNDLDHARQDYGRALELKPDFIQAKENLARLSSPNPAAATPPPAEIH